MKFSVAAEIFTLALNTASRATARRTTIPILSHFLLRAQKGSLSVAASDTEIACQLAVPAAVKAEGAVALPADKLSLIAKAFTGSIMEFSTQDNFTVIACPGSSFRLHGLKPENFPAWPQMEEPLASLPVAALNSALAQAAIALGDEAGTRYALNAVLMDEGIMVSCTGHRLCMIAVDWARNIKKMLIPTKAVHFLTEIFTGGILEVGRSAGHLFFRGPGCEMVARRTEGQFPDYRSVIPAEEKIVVLGKFSSTSLLTALERALIVTENRGQSEATPHLVEMIFADNRLTLHAASATGHYEENCSVQARGQMKVFFNAMFWLDFLRLHRDTTVTFALTAADGVARLVVGEHTYLLMPSKKT
jgi:DNA polymerase III, beta subunit